VIAPPRLSRRPAARRRPGELAEGGGDHALEVGWLDDLRIERVAPDRGRIGPRAVDGAIAADERDRQRAERQVGEIGAGARGGLRHQRRVERGVQRQRVADPAALERRQDLAARARPLSSAPSTIEPPRRIETWTPGWRSASATAAASGGDGRQPSSTSATTPVVPAVPAAQSRWGELSTIKALGLSLGVTAASWGALAAIVYYRCGAMASRFLDRPRPSLRRVLSPEPP
jgi:hypothetical protein